MFLTFRCSARALLESVTYMMGNVGGTVYAPNRKPIVSARLMLAVSAPHCLGRRQALISRTFAMRFSHKVDLGGSDGLISGARIQTDVVAIPSSS
jgi:hypothetical protein